MNHTFPFLLLLSTFGYKLMGQEDNPEKEMATHSNILTWKTPQTEEPGELHPQGHHNVGHDFVTKQQQGQCFGQQYCLD